MTLIARGKKAEPQKAELAANTSSDSVTVEGLPHMLHRETRLVVSGSLGERKKALKQLVAVLSDIQLATVAAKQCWGELDCLLNAISDTNSTCRENAALALTSLVPQMIAGLDAEPSEEFFISLVGTIKEQLIGDGDERKAEEIEEARTKQLVLLETLLVAWGERALPEASIAPMALVVNSACLDLCPDVKKVGCACAVFIAPCLSTDTEEPWEGLLKALAYDTSSAIGHQQYKVREVALRTIGQVMPHAPAKCWEEMVKFVKKVHFDRHPKMRAALLDVILGWLLQSCAAPQLSSLLLQLMMGEADEVEEVAEAAEGAFARAATSIESGDQAYSNPLEAVEALVEGQLQQLVDELLIDMAEWRAVTRRKGGQTMGVLVRYAGDALGSHIASVIEALCKLCRDDEDTVAAAGFETAELIGESLEAAVWVPVMVKDLRSGAFQDSIRVSQLQVLSSMLATSGVDELCPVLDDLLAALASPILTFEAGPEVHSQVLDCVTSMVETLGEQVSEHAELFFDAVLMLRAAAVENAELCVEIDESTLELAQQLQLPSVAALYGACASNCLPRLLEWASNGEACCWSLTSPELSQVEAVLLLADPVCLTSQLRLIVKAVAAVVHQDAGSDQEVQLRVVMMLGALSSEVEICKALRPIYSAVLADIIKPACKWYSGRMVERKREAASELLRRTLRAGCMRDLVDDEYMVKVVFEAVSQGVDDDWVPEMRRASTICLGELIEALGKGKTLSFALLEEIWPLLSKRLDDDLDEVRAAALTALEQYLRYVPEDATQEHLESMITVLSIHLDDPHSKIRELASEVLKQAVKVSPRCVIKRCEEVRMLHQTPVHCDELIAAAKKLLGEV